MRKKRLVERGRQVRQARELAAHGRGGDTEIAHVSRGELVIPRALQNPKVLVALREAAAENNISLEMLAIGNVLNRINPETGVPEFWFEGLGDRISKFFGNDDVDDTQAVTEGGATRGAYDGIKNDLIRGQYDEQVRQLGPFDDIQRAEYKTDFRKKCLPK